MTARTPTAFAPVPSLLTSLSRAGWGPLAGYEYQGLRSTLKALADRLPHKSGQGAATAEQVAASTGLSERWVRRCLGVLEDLGLIEWARGGIRDGAPQPSFFRIIKASLVALIKAARPMRDRAIETHRARFLARLETLRQSKWVVSKSRKREVEPLAAPHAELSAGLRPSRGRLYQGGPRRNHSKPTTKEPEVPKYSLARRPPSSITAEDLQALNIRRRRAGLPPWQWSVDRWRYEEEDLGLPPAPPLHVSEAKAAARFIARGGAVPAALAARIRRDVAASALLLEMTGVQL